MRQIKKQTGFSLIEVIVALSLVLILMATTQPVVSRLLDFRSNIITDTRINALGGAIEEWYSENAWQFDQIADSNIPLPGGGFISNNSGTRSDGFERLAQKFTGSIDNTQNGYNYGFRVFVSNPLSQEYKGVLVPYHVIVLVSSRGLSENINEELVSVVESSFDQNTGSITKRENETIYVINSFAIQKKMLDESIDRLERVAKSYEDFYRLSFISRGREPSVNYFGRDNANVRWDVRSPVQALCGGSSDTILSNNQLGHNINNYGLLNVIGISQEAGSSAWGEPFRLLNCGSTSSVRIRGINRTISARTPNSGSGNNIPPYSAILGFHLPNAETYTTTITSSF